ncbi:MAG: class I SAM-dependent methyltransferase [Candidatus Hodarchaeota archaeon]
MKNTLKLFLNIISLPKIFLNWYCLIIINMFFNLDIVLDIGCGDGAFMSILKKNWLWKKKNPHIIIGLDISKDALSNEPVKMVYDERILCDVKCMPLRYLSVDLSLCICVIEHLIKNDGIILLNNIDFITKKQSILVTHVGYVPSDDHYSIYQIHRSGFLPKELYKYDYDVKGIVGVRGLFLKYVNSKITKSFIFLLTVHMSRLICYLFPNVAYSMLCMKKYCYE